MSKEKQLYALTALPTHLSNAGQTDQLKYLLWQINFWHNKVDIAGPNELLDDLFLLKYDEDLETARMALQLSVHIIEKDKSQLFSQLLGRLPTNKSPKINSFIREIENKSVGPRLIPLSQSLTSPGGNLQRTFEGPTYISSILGLSDGKMVVAKKHLWVINVEKGTVLQEISGHSDEVNAILELPNKRIVSASSDHTLKIWDLDTGANIAVLRGHSDKVIGVAAISEKNIVSGSTDNSLRVWNTRTNETTMILTGHSDEVSAIAVLPNKQIVSAGKDHTLRVWSLDKDTPLRTFSGNFETRKSRALSKGKVLSEAETHVPERVKKILPLPNGSVVILSNNTTLRVWDPETGSTLRLLEGHRATINSMAILPNYWIASASIDETIKIWDAEIGTMQLSISTFDDWIEQITTLQNGRIISASTQGIFRAWSITK